MVMDADVPVVESGGKTDSSTATRRLLLSADQGRSRAARRRRSEARRRRARRASHAGPHEGLHDLDDEGAGKAGKTYDVVIIGSPNVNPGYKLVDNAAYPEIAEDYEKDVPGPEVAAVRHLPRRARRLLRHGGQVRAAEGGRRERRSSIRTATGSTWPKGAGLPDGVGEAESRRGHPVDHGRGSSASAPPTTTTPCCATRKGLREELEATFLARMQKAQLTFGGRTLCPFPRPNFVSPEVYRQIQGVCRGIFRAIEKAEATLGPELFDRVDLTPEERELVAIPSGYRRSSPTSRLDSFLTTDAYRFVELNAETPAGIGYNEVLVEVFLELPLVKKFQERYVLRRFRARERVLETLLDCYREAGGKAAKPTIAVVDYDEVPTRTEHHMFREFFEANGCPSLVCDPRHLSFEGGRLRYEGRADRHRLQASARERAPGPDRREPGDAAGGAGGGGRDREPFRCKPIHKKAIFAVLTEDELQPLFTAEEQAAIRAHVPWTRRVREGRATRTGAEHRPARVRAQEPRDAS